MISKDELNKMVNDRKRRLDMIRGEIIEYFISRYGKNVAVEEEELLKDEEFMEMVNRYLEERGIHSNVKFVPFVSVSRNLVRKYIMTIEVGGSSYVLYNEDHDVLYSLMVGVALVLCVLYLLVSKLVVVS